MRKLASSLVRNGGFAILLLLIQSFATAQAPTPAAALAFEQQGRTAEAVRVWRAVTQANPHDAGAFASLGLDLARLEKYAEAERAYRTALALNPKLPGIRLNLGLAEFKQGNFRAAIVPFESVLEAEPSNQQARTLLGISYYGAKQFSAAVKHLKLALEAEPANTQLRQMLAQSCLNAKEFPCAVEEFRKILEQNPDSAAAHVLMGEALDGLTRLKTRSWSFSARPRSRPRKRTFISELDICTGSSINTLRLSASSRPNWRSIRNMGRPWHT